MATVVGLVLLRLAIGWHFFSEGTDKLQNGFSAAGFLGNAKGPFAGMYTGMVRDPDGLKRLAYVPEGKTLDDGRVVPYDLQFAIDAWHLHRERVASHYAFGDEAIEAQIQADRETLKTQIEEAQADGDDARADRLAAERKDREQQVLRLRKQTELADAIVVRYERQLRSFYAANHADIVEYFQGLVRRANNAADPARSNVASLRGQSEKVTADLKKKVRPWLAEIDAMWNGVDAELNGLAVDEQRSRGAYRLALPGDRGLDVDFVNGFIPWFDTIIGLLLLFGLLTRPAAIVGALFLGSVVLSQWPGAYGAAPVAAYVIEGLALVVLAAAGAGRFAGLDFFLGCLRVKCCPPKQTQESN